MRLRLQKQKGASGLANQNELWRELYKAAAREPDRGLRLHRIVEAQSAMLQHALFLEQTQGSDEECRELEQAADELRLMKLVYGGGKAEFCHNC